MHSMLTRLLLALATIVLPALHVPPVNAQNSTGGSKMFCWKNKAGVTECGDKVPYEYQDAAIKEMNRQGVITGRSESLTPEERKAREAAEQKRLAEAKRKDEQRRQDKALIDTFSNEKEIDLKRSRDITLVEANIETLQGNLKNMNERQTDSRLRAERYTKDKKPVPPGIQDDIDRVNREMAQTNRQIQQLRKDIVALNQRYDDMKRRYAELTGGTTATPQKK